MSHLWFPVIQDTLGKSANPGHWQGHNPQALDELASKLSYDGIATQINSLPTPWSRAVQIEQAIIKPDYPTRDELLNELFGCLAVVGLSGLYHLKLTAHLLQLKQLRKDQEVAVHRFATSLWENEPDVSQSVLKKRPDGASPWERLIIFTIDDDTAHQSQPIGFASPSSILCPTTQLRHQIAGVPWSQGGRFSDPTPYLSLTQHKQPLANWLDHLREAILSCKPNANTELAEALCQVLKEFINRLEVKPFKELKKGALIFEFKNTGFDFLAHSAAPVKSEHNCCRVILKDKQSGNPTVILVDPDMQKQLQKPASEIQLYGPDTLETISGDAAQLRERHKDINVVTPDDLFLRNLTLLPGGDALCHSWLPEKLTARLEVGNQEDATPLLPFSVRLQELFSSKEMKEMVNLAVDHSQGHLIVELILRLEGFEKEEEYRIKRRYPLGEANVLRSIPVMAVWPSIPDSHWHKYWIFSQMVDGFSIEATPGWEGPLGNLENDQVRYFCSTSFPDLLSVRVGQSPGGLIPLESPEPIGGSGGDSWNVGLDFGTSFTNWAIWDGNQTPDKLQLELALWTVTVANDQVQRECLNRYFLAHEMHPVGNNPPTSTSLSVLGCDQKKITPDLFHEARLHIPQSGEESKADNQKSYLRTGFKWENPEFQEPFLKQLALMISAHAVRAGVSEIKWSLSYPTTLPNNARRNYQKLWEDLTGELKEISRIDHKLREDRPLLSEAVAFACCLSENSKIFQHTACMDIGGRTTDISLWQESRLIHQVSVPFAGQHICTKLLDHRPEFASDLLGGSLASMQKSSGKSMESNRLSRIDNYIRFNSESLLQSTLPRRRSPRQSGRDKTLEQFISLMALATGGLYHYLGFIVRCLYENKKLKKGACVSVHVGGNGGQLLRWLDPTCQFDQDSQVNQWLSRIQASAINLNNDKSAGETHLSEKFKDEVAIGLVVDQRHLHDLNRSESKPFSGESLRINQHEFAATDPISLHNIDHGEDVTNMKLLDLKELQRYVRGMVKAMEGIRDDLQMDPVVQESDLEGALGERVLARAQALCDQHLGDRDNPKKMGDFSVEPGFFLGLRALIEELAEDWKAKS